jgi:hypothetical protein
LFRDFPRAGTGENKTPPRAKWMPPRAKNPGKNTLLPGTARLKCGMHFEMKSLKYIHVLGFGYEDGIKIKNKYFATIYELHICPIKPSAGLPSLMRLSL